MALIQVSPEVFLAEGPIATIGHEDIELLRTAVRKTPKRRVRINAHPGSSDELHEMMIAIEPGSYIRPHKHPGKSESFHIIEGQVDIVVFGEDGNVERVVSLAAKGGRHPFYYRMSAPHFHTLIIRSDLLVVHEITNGPFLPAGTVYASFAPAEDDVAAAAAFQANLVRRVAAMQETAR
ncbi:WbuC family cupin fold metalloprotein [Bradyrhizobium diazoefficiens]|nr:WbuC family cupin fold metalloprotein [Bradyrhizobium diazoefficiens]MBR0848970.1 WbuC family cupin fold metalloprotein [Bradyrhizobium diazoefficiens]